MALATDFRDDGRTLMMSGSGVLTGREFIHAKEALLAQQEQVRSITRAMILLEDVSVLDVTPDEIRQLVGLDQQMATLTPHVAVAVVAPKDYMFGLARVWETLVESVGWQTDIFRTRPDAEAWLQTIQPSSR
jgi:hypothetical protein